jgi:hypothetical protein
LRTAIIDDSRRKCLETFNERERFCATVCFNHADNDVGALRALFAPFRKHRVGFTDTCCGAEKNFEPAAAAPGLSEV